MVRAAVPCERPFRHTTITAIGERYLGVAVCGVDPHESGCGVLDDRLRPAGHPADYEVGNIARQSEEAVARRPIPFGRDHCFRHDPRVSVPAAIGRKDAGDQRVRLDEREGGEHW